MQVTPLTPQEAVEQKLSDVPTKVLQCWNKIIKANLNKTNSSVTSRFTLNALAKMISSEMACSFGSAKNKGWFELEPLFIQSGWNVQFHRASYADDFDSYFYFEANLNKLFK